MIARTEGIVLRIGPFSRTSHVVTWLTPDRGRLVTINKGARRPKSDFLGRYDLFQTCELLYYERERNGLHICRECVPLHARSAFRTAWRATACASYVADIVWRVSLHGPHHESLYHLVQCSLDALCQADAVLPLLFWFELRLAGVLGFAPHLHSCPSCGARHAMPAAAVFSPEGGGLVCRGCVQKAGRSPEAEMSAGVVAMLRHWQDESNPRAALTTRCTGVQYRELQENLGAFLQYHLDSPLRSRYVAMEIVSAEVHQTGPHPRPGPTHACPATDATAGSPA